MQELLSQYLLEGLFFKLQHDRSQEVDKNHLR